MYKRILTLALALMLMITPLLTAAPAAAEESYITVNFHYFRPDGDYTNWNLWAWDYYGQTLIYGNDEYGNMVDMPAYSFIVEDGIAVATLHVSTYVDYMGYIVRYGDWEGKDMDYDQFIDLSGVNGTVVDLYIVSGVPTSDDMFPATDELITNGFMVVDGDGTEWEPPYYIPDESAEPVNVYAFIPEHWNEVYLWTWDEEDNSVQGDTPWPGELCMTYVGDGAYYMEIPAGYNNMLLTDRGIEQTIDISTSVEPGGEIYIDATDPANPIVYYSMSELVDNCPHNFHDNNGMCTVCGTIVDHVFDTNGYCSCGEYRQSSVIIRPGDSGIILNPDIDSDMLVTPEGGNSIFYPQDGMVSEEAQMGSVPRFLVLILVVVVVLILALLALAVPIVLVVVVVIIIVAIVKKKKK